VKNYCPLHAHSIYSLLDGISRPSEIAQFCLDNDIKSFGLTDHGNISGQISFREHLHKKGIKPISGCELYISEQPGYIKTPQNRRHIHLPILAKNKAGWDKLIKLVSKTNENFYHKPRVSLDEIKEFSGDFWAFSGHAGSTLTTSIFTSNDVYREPEENVLAYLNPNWKEDLTKSIYQHFDIFGKENFFIEIQLIDQDNIPAVKVLAKILRETARELNIPCIGTADSHYTYKKDAILQRVVLCSALRTTIKEVQYKIKHNEEFGLSGFFRSDNYHIPTPQEMRNIHTQEELENTLYIADQTEDFNLGGKVLLPNFSCPNGLTQDEYLTKLCWDNFHKCPGGSIYEERLKMELDVLIKNGLSSYFLIVQDYVRWVKRQGVIVGISRGSAGGCLVSYLLDITELDPIPYNLVFERFYNEGRNQPGRISLPDIDSDFPKEYREKVIQYLRDTYGSECVSHIITLSSLAGKGALKEVLHVYDVCGQDEMNAITSRIPHEAEISDELQIMEETTGQSSIIQWALENKPQELKEWVFLDNDRNLSGDYAEYFDIAIRLEGIKKNESKHASGIIISDTPLKELLKSNNSDNLILRER
jgi:DNA polymerase-3 subunit alpha